MHVVAAQVDPLLDDPTGPLPHLADALPVGRYVRYVAYSRKVSGSAKSGSAACNRRCRARAMNRRTEDGTASVSARTSRQFRPPPPAMVRPGGLMFVATINRTMRSFALAIVGTLAAGAVALNLM